VPHELKLLGKFPRRFSLSIPLYDRRQGRKYAHQDDQWTAPCFAQAVVKHSKQQSTRIPPQRREIVIKSV
jgi:hypothetical protein